MAMNEDEALSKFVTDNLNFFLSEDVILKTLKTKTNDYFYKKHKNKYGTPSKKQIAKALVSLLLKKTISPEKIEEFILTLPIFQLSGNNQKEYISLLSTSDHMSVLSAQEIERINKVGAYKAIKQTTHEGLNELKNKKIQDIEHEISLKQQQLDALPSVLDHVDPIPQELDLKIDKITPWWERFYLSSDPFPTKAGLSQLDTKLYESVVVKTQPFVETLNNLQSNPNYLFNTGVLLSGGFGFGKTTFLDYLNYYLIQQNIITIKISQTKAYPDSNSYVDHFLNRLIYELKQILGNKVKNHDFEGLDPDLHIQKLCDVALAEKPGMVIMLDDYHKHNKANPSIIFDFIGQLQITKDSLETQGLKVGFIVSGLPEWREKLKTDLSLSGFLDKPPIEMPQLTPKIICDAFNQRIHAFSFSSTPNLIKHNFIEALFTKEDCASGGYRYYLTAIQDELNRNNMAILNTPIEISEKDLTRIKSEIEKYQSLKISFNKLTITDRTKGFTSEIIIKHLTILVSVYMHGGITEDSLIFLDNKQFLKTLAGHNLIQKLRLKNESAEFKWVVSENLQKAAAKIKSKYDKEINDYLLKIFSPKKIQSDIYSKEPEAISKIQPYITFFNGSDINISKSSKQNLDDAFRVFQTVSLSKSFDSGEATIYIKPIGQIKNAIEFLSNAFFDIDQSNPFFNLSKIKTTRNKWQQHWVDYDAIDELFDHLEKFDCDSSRLEYEHVSLRFSDVFIYLADLLMAITTNLCLKKDPFSFYHNVIHHTKQELDLFTSAKENYYSAEPEAHFIYVSRFSSYLEERLRLFLYSAGGLIFGDLKYKDYIPKQIRLYGFKNIENKNYSAILNFFNGLTRSQYREFFCADNEYNNLVVKFLGLHWHRDDFKSFFDYYAEIDVSTRHDRKDKFSITDRDKYINYVSKGAEFLSAINNFMSQFITNYGYVIRGHPEASEVDDHVLRFSTKLRDQGVKSFKNFPAVDKSRIFEENKETNNLFFEPIYGHMVAQEIISKIKNSFDHKFSNVEMFTVDLLDPEFIASHYSVYYSQFISSLLFLSRVRKEIEVIPWFESSVLIKKT
jgi:hypothetical protein